MPDPRFVAVLKANGRNYPAFKTVTVRREYGDTVSYFQLTCSEAGSLGGANDARRLVPGTPVQIWLGGVLALDGAITSRAASYSARSHDVVIGGRSGTYKAADSSVNVEPGNFNGYTLEQAAKGVLAPHGINLKIVNPPSIVAKPFRFMAVNPGETVVSFIERMCLMRGCFLWDDVDGSLCIGQGDPRAAVVADLQEGRNILGAVIKLDDQDIYSAFSFYGQQPSTDDDMAVRTAQATVANPSATDSRIKISPAEHVGDSQDMTARANLEAARSAWPSVDAVVTVVGWVRADGKLWNHMENVSVYSPIGLPNGTGKMTLGVQAITFAQNAEEGTTTTLDLKLPGLLTSTPHTDVQTDGTGGFKDDPNAGRAVPPDYQTGTSIGPGGQFGHA